jgi:hypothetical protein
MTTGGPGAASLLLTAPAGPRLARLAAFVAADLVLRVWHDGRLPVTYLVAVADHAAAVDAALGLDLTSLGVIPPDAVAAGEPAAVAGAVRARLGARVDVLAAAAGSATQAEAVEALLAAADTGEHGAGAAGRRVQRHLVVAGPGEGADPDPDAAPMALRLLLLAHRYDEAWAYSPEELAAASARLERWVEAVSGNGGPPCDELLAAVRAALGDDLDTPRALREVDAWAEAALAVGTPAGPPEAELVEGSPGVVARAIDALLGVRV